IALRRVAPRLLDGYEFGRPLLLPSVLPETDAGNDGQKRKTKVSDRFLRALDSMVQVFPERRQTHSQNQAQQDRHDQIPRGLRLDRRPGRFGPIQDLHGRGLDLTGELRIVETAEEVVVSLSVQIHRLLAKRVACRSPSQGL